MNRKLYRFKCLYFTKYALESLKNPSDAFSPKGITWICKKLVEMNCGFDFKLSGFPANDYFDSLKITVRETGANNFHAYFDAYLDNKLLRRLMIEYTEWGSFNMSIDILTERLRKYFKEHYDESIDRTRYGWHFYLSDTFTLGYQEHQEFASKVFSTSMKQIMSHLRSRRLPTHFRG